MARVRFPRRFGKKPERTCGAATAVRGARSAFEPLGRRVSGAARCRRGAYAVEFAMVSTILVPVLMGAIELSWQFAASVALENATLEASRVATLGRKDAKGAIIGPACEEAIKKAAIDAAIGLLSINRLTMTPTTFTDPKDLINKSKTGTAGTGDSGTYVRYRLQYRQPFLFAPQIFAGKTEMIHDAVFAVKNEPYPNVKNKTPC